MPAAGRHLGAKPCQSDTGGGRQEAREAVKADTRMAKERIVLYWDSSFS